MIDYSLKIFGRTRHKRLATIPTDPSNIIIRYLLMVSKCCEPFFFLLLQSLALKKSKLLPSVVVVTASLVLFW